MVGMSVRETDRREPAKTPTRLTPSNLCPFAAIKERKRAIDADKQAREPAFWQRQHATRSQQHDLDHRDIATSTMSAMSKS